MDKDELFKEIDLIQACIERMSKNSFLLKGWALTIFAGVFAVTKAEVMDNTWLLICAGVVPFVCFWMLDAFFLHTEKKYRALYSWVLANRKEDNKEYQFDLNPNRFSSQVGCYLKTMFSWTIGLFYGIPLLAVLCWIISKPNVDNMIINF